MSCLSGSAGNVPVNGVIAEGAAVNAIDNGGVDGNSLSGGVGDISVNGVVMEGAAVDAVDDGGGNGNSLSGGVCDILLMGLLWRVQPLEIEVATTMPNANALAPQERQTSLRIGLIVIGGSVFRHGWCLLREVMTKKRTISHKRGGVLPRRRDQVMMKMGWMSLQKRRGRDCPSFPTTIDGGSKGRR